MAKFTPVPPQPDWPALERDILAMWDETRAFETLTELNRGAKTWAFLDGPITANNPMGVHHAWGRAFKDLWQRFHAMQGSDERWQNGFDCQGLWVEVEVEKELGFKSKRDIETYGIAAFVRRCKERVLRFAARQTEQSIRLGMWMKWDDPDMLRWLADHIDESEPVTVDTPSGPVTATVEWLVSRLGLPPWDGSYFTFSDENNTMIWQFLRRCHERGWIYKGTDVMPWCTRCGTGLSQHEIATEGYRETTHRSPTLRLPLVGRPGESLLVWTTTPWTLPANVAAAVGPKLTYVRVRQGDEVFYVAEGAAKTALTGEFEIEARFPGSDLVGWRYTGPFDHLPAAVEARDAHRVIAWDEVGEEEGTGIVHIAPGCGAEDFALSKVNKLPVIAPLLEDGRYRDGFDELSGLQSAEVSAKVIVDLEARGLLYRAEPFTHRYPVCWRCSSELVFRLVDEWFISMGEVYDKPRAELTPDEKGASLRYQIMDVVDEITWVPSFGRERELDWLRNMHDWMISKKRYWGLALPIWVCEDCGAFDVIGGLDDLQSRATAGWDELEGHSPHRPYVDAVLVACKECGGTARRIPDVGNPWLDAGIVPFSTVHYSTDHAYWAKWFPADFITESFPGQFRNWFYSLLVMSTVLEGREPFRAIFGYATLFAEDGRPMHKSAGNMIPFDDAAEEIGADVMRWMYLASRPEQNLMFGYHGAKEVRRRFLLPLWNVFGFMVQYANIAGWEPRVPALTGALDGALDGGSTAPDGEQEASELDRWLRLRLAQLETEVSRRLLLYEPYETAMAVEGFVEELSNWYVRRSRRRFWDGDPAALQTLYTTLVRLCQIVAPLMPFTSETLYQTLVREVDGAAPTSVHHTRWPKSPAMTPEDDALLVGMALVQKLAALGRSARSSADVKLRQPLAKALVSVRSPAEAVAVQGLTDHLRDELNVKAIEVITDEGALVTHSVRSVLPALGPKYGAKVPLIRQALAAEPAAEVARRVRAGETIVLEAGGETFTLEPSEIEVMASARPGLATAELDGYVVGIETELTPELVTEGFARDLVRHVNQLRKDSGLAITDRIRLEVEGPEAVTRALAEWRDLVAADTLALAVGVAGDDAGDGAAGHGALAGAKGAHHETTVDIDGTPVVLRIAREAE